MDMALYASFVIFAVGMSITPGPNNLMLMSSSALFGVRATLPHWIGVNLGFNIMLVAAVFGLGELVVRYPWSLTVVKTGGAVWLLWMAWLFVKAGLRPLAQPADPANDAGKDKSKTGSRPFRVHEAALFQWVNPKALLMTISAAGAYIALAEGPTERAALMVGTFLVFGSPCGLVWAMAGGKLRRFMAHPKWSRLLNLSIAAILVLTIGLIVLG
jgi:threonine/homoserine/homoserine lactone efflux protein